MSSVNDLQQLFLEQIRPNSMFYLLFEHLPEDVVFFAKDLEGRIMLCNRRLLERFLFEREEQIIGKTDFDLHLPSMATKYRADDHVVMRDGTAMLNIVELFLNRQGIPDWYLTNKLPIYSKDNKVIGVMGTIQKYISDRQIPTAVSDQILARALLLIKNDFTEAISIENLAREAGMSLRNFERRFRKVMRTTPRQFITKMRIMKACDALRITKRSISEISVDCGFYDQAALTRAFHKHMGITPHLYRRHFG